MALPVRDAEPRGSESGILDRWRAEPRFESPQIDAWGVEDGLPENSATSMVQSAEGYLWFGTFQGLVRFDGREFSVFDRNNTPELPSSGIIELHLDSRGRMWVCTLGGVVLRDGEQWRLVHRGEAAREEYVLTLAERAGGEMLLTLHDGAILEVKGEEVRRLPPPPGAPKAGYQAWAGDDGRWWVVQHGFLGSWNGQEWVARLPDLGIPAPGVLAVGAGPARDGGVWIFREREVRKYRGGVEVERRSLEGLGQEVVGTFASLFEDSDHQVWLCTYESGLIQISPGGGVRRWTERDGLTYRDVRFVFEDRERNLWVGTSGGGLMRLKPRRFEVFAPESPGEAPILVSAVSPADGDSLWVATFGQGLFRLGEEGRTRRMRVPGWNADSRFFETVLSDRRSRTWVSILNEGLRVFGPEGGREIPIAASSGHQVRALFEDGRGRIWTSGGGGLSVFDGDSVRTLPGGQSVPTGSVVGFEEADDGRIWFSNLEGLYRLEGERAVEVRDAMGGPVRGVTCLKRAARGGLWLGTLERGLLRWRDGAWAGVGLEGDEGGGGGLPVQSIHGILGDEDGHLWMASDRGVVRCREADLEARTDRRVLRLPCQVLDRSDGLPSAECSRLRQPVAARDRHGRLWFATRRGVVRIDPGRLRLNPVPPAVLIERAAYEVPTAGHGRPHVRMVELRGRAGSLLRLPAGCRRIEFRHVGLSYAAPEKVRYEVRLDGADVEWRGLGGERVTVYQNLPPGRYVHRVRAVSGDGVWNEDGARVEFELPPLVWQTGWFRVGVGLALVNAGGALAWWRSRRRVRAALEREQAAVAIRDLAGRLIRAQEDERRRIARELHDDFSQRLALLSVEMEMEMADGASGRRDPDESTRGLGGFVERVKELSSEVHRMAHELHPAKLDQLGLVAATRSFCRELAGKSGVRIEFRPGDLPRQVPSEMALCLYRVVQEGLRNAVRHSGAAGVTVEFCRQPAGLGLVIEDQGCGFEPGVARRNGGLGLSSMEERVRSLAGRWEIRSGPGLGTRIEVTLPLPLPAAPASAEEGGAS